MFDVGMFVGGFVFGVTLFRVLLFLLRSKAKKERIAKDVQVTEWLRSLAQAGARMEEDFTELRKTQGRSSAEILRLSEYAKRLNARGDGFVRSMELYEKRAGKIEAFRRNVLNHLALFLDTEDPSTAGQEANERAQTDAVVPDPLKVKKVTIPQDVGLHPTFGLDDFPLTRKPDRDNGPGGGGDCRPVDVVRKADAIERELGRQGRLGSLRAPQDFRQGPGRDRPV